MQLNKAFRFARSCYALGNQAPRPAPLPAAEALKQARGLVAGLPLKEKAAKAAWAAREAQRPIDSRRYAPAWMQVSEAFDKAAKAARKAGAFQYAGPVWGPGPGGNWQDSGAYYLERPDSLFRNVIPAADLLTGRDVAQGFYSDSNQQEVCTAFVVQLPSRKGRARYAAAYGFDARGGLSVDLSRIFESDFEAEREAARRQIGKAYWQKPMESPGYWGQAAHESAQKEAAKAAQGLAEKAAEKERGYDSAWQAGCLWLEKLEEEKEARREALALLQERRAAGALQGGQAFPAICKALRGEALGLWQQIRKSRKERAALAQGDSPAYYFFPSEKLKGAFCEGAGLESFPV